MKFSLKISFFLIGSLFFFSCKKDTVLVTPESRLTHSWKLRYQGSDANKNNQFDLEEKNKVTDSASFSYQFKSGGKGFRVGNNTTFIDTLTWEMVGSNGIRIKLTHNSLVQDLSYIYEVGTDVITLKDTTVQPGYYREFILEP
jgi:hypothetical protein